MIVVITYLLVQLSSNIHDNRLIQERKLNYRKDKDNYEVENKKILCLERLVFIEEI
jgi:hypothetical protein